MSPDPASLLEMADYILELAIRDLGYSRGYFKAVVYNINATPLLLGGSAVLFFRENETKPFNPDDALELPFPAINSPTDLTEAFGSVGLNWTTIRYDGTKPFSGSVDPLFKN